MKALDEAYEAEMERLQPLNVARDEAATQLERRLAANAVLAARHEASAAKTRVEDARKRAAAKRKDEKDAYIEAAKLDTAREANEKRVEETTSEAGSLPRVSSLLTNQQMMRARMRRRLRRTHSLGSM